ncbi:hypothetical protein K227x_31300 [Rubripirellula lacrimiformis]|uniref:Uncharacterized protein n=1 Tax=Rubripirellula lacrimiformis TaxID=1930273 RepID=A0A517NC65_9BACT|nr:hypothetical protein [Rubripirellula lacrimiformis]QDT04735.1 hypothetical protein K227x_31300 [Rubripirellula lacrimiformis]
MSPSRRILESTLAFAAVVYATSCLCDSVGYSRDPIESAKLEISAEADVIRDLITRRNSEVSVRSAMDPSVVSLDKQIEELRTHTNLPPYWPRDNDRLRNYRATGNAQPTIDALVDRVLLLEAEVRALKTKQNVGE